MKYIVLILLLIATSFVESRTTDTYVFEDEVTEIRYKALVKELRCPKCQNQNLADSNSPIAADLRREVYQLLQQGKADLEIVDFMVKRYGEFVLYRPKVSSITYILWFGPAFLLVIGVMIVIYILRKKPAKKASATLSQEQKSKLAQILEDK